MKLILNWSDYRKYTYNNVQQFAPASAGVYKIAIEQSDNTLKVRYIGQTDDIDKRLKEHLDLDKEQNECLVERLKKYSAWFSCATVDRKSDRDGIEMALYNYYKPVCNDPKAIPNGPIIDANLV